MFTICCYNIRIPIFLMFFGFTLPAIAEGEVSL